MQVDSTRLLDAPLIEVAGEIDHGNASLLTAAFESTIDEGADIVLLDLSDVTYLDSGGISAILAAVRHLRDRGWLGAINPNANVRRLLEIVGLSVDNGFRVFPDRTEAEKALGESSES